MIINLPTFKTYLKPQIHEASCSLSQSLQYSSNKQSIKMIEHLVIPGLEPSITEKFNGDEILAGISLIKLDGTTSTLFFSYHPNQSKLL